ncbi:MAG: hypothetical protein JXB46_07305 [Candidatus Eisenbacteria bacterium]|nr:hypothetical protein [Candidatus Eisenbacteria bacterium]
MSRVNRAPPGQLEGLHSNTGLDLVAIALSLVASVASASDLIITGLIDGPLSGGLPKAVELKACADIPDLSIYGLGCANNGGGTDGTTFVLANSYFSGVGALGGETTNATAANPFPIGTYLCGGASAVESTTWGIIKSLYN